MRWSTILMALSRHFIPTNVAQTPPPEHLLRVWKADSTAAAVAVIIITIRAIFVWMCTWKKAMDLYTCDLCWFPFPFPLEPDPDAHVGRGKLKLNCEL